VPKTLSDRIDGREVTAPGGELLIKAAEDNGTYIPRFCWHPRMKPVGMCRMCLVEVETPRGKGLTTACTMRVAEGMVVHTKSDVVKKAQEGVLEFLLINHPLDCPVCDKGGECPLQDQTLAHGPGESRFVEEKRHFEKPIPISELVLLDRESVGHAGDVVGDHLSGGNGAAALGVAAPVVGQVFWVFEYHLEQVTDHPAGFRGHAVDMFVSIHVGEQEIFYRPDMGLHLG